MPAPPQIGSWGDARTRALTVAPVSVQVRPGRAGSSQPSDPCPGLLRLPALARYRHLTTRETNKLTPTQAQTAVAAAILRQLHFVVTHRQVWDPVVAAHGIRSLEVAAA